MAAYPGFLLFGLSIVLLIVDSVATRRAMTGFQHEQVGGPVALHANADTVSTPEPLPSLVIALWVRVVVTMVLLLAALFVILSKQYQADQQKWAFGVIGTILGYWLKT